MAVADLLGALVVGILQGIFEWLPISSEGNITIILTWLGYSATRAINYSLFLHLGTALAATVYFRGEIRSLLVDLPLLRVQSYDSSLHRFLIIGTLVSGVTGIAAYALLIELVSAMEGGVLIIAIGVLLIATGLFQRQSTRQPASVTQTGSSVDAILTGIGQGLAILPGVSRSGTTTGILLLRGYDGQTAFRLSFLLSIPAAIGAGLLVLVEVGGLPSVGYRAGVVALAASAIAGYLSIDVLMRVARHVSFAMICLGLGVLAILGGWLVLWL